MLTEVNTLKNNQRYCNHCPQPSAGKWKSFCEYLFCREKYYSRTDSSAVCAKCSTHILTPKFYRSPLFLLIYGIAIFGITIGIFLLFLGKPGKLLQLFGLFTMAWILFDRVLVAAIFTFAKWTTDEDVGKYGRKDAIWGNRRMLFGLFCAQCAIILMKILR